MLIDKWGTSLGKAGIFICFERKLLSAHHTQKYIHLHTHSSKELFYAQFPLFQCCSLQSVFQINIFLLLNATSHCHCRTRLKFLFQCQHCNDITGMTKKVACLFINIYFPNMMMWVRQMLKPYYYISHWVCNKSLYFYVNFSSVQILILKLAIFSKISVENSFFLK